MRNKARHFGFDSTFDYSHLLTMLQLETSDLEERALFFVQHVPSISTIAFKDKNRSNERTPLQVQVLKAMNQNTNLQRFNFL